MKVAGLDVVVFLRLLKYGVVLFAFATVWCCALLMPINGTVGVGVGVGVGVEGVCVRRPMPRDARVKAQAGAGHGLVSWMGPPH
jgi:hypothetical protein